MILPSLAATYFMIRYLWRIFPATRNRKFTSVALLYLAVFGILLPPVSPIPSPRRSRGGLAAFFNNCSFGVCLRTFSFILLFLGSASISLPASFTNGQAARAILGQAAFTDSSVAPVVNNIQTALPNLLGGPSGLAYYSGLLFVADDNRLGALPENNRVVIFDTTQIPGAYTDPSSSAFLPSSRCYLCGYYGASLLGQVDFSETNAGRNNLPTAAAGSLNRPVAVATDNQHFAVADSDNNRVLLWNSIPLGPNVPPDFVLGQANFTSFQTPQLVNANSLRGPQGVWIQNGKVFVADTQNYRVLIWNSFPTRSNQPADLVLGQANFLASVHPPATSVSPATTASQLLNPVSVTSDGTHLFISDLGSNRVLIWNTIPTVNDAPADVVIGQASTTTSIPNNSPAVCASTGTDSTGAATYPVRCEATLNFPRFALAGGGKLFVADSGNDRVLIFNSIPTMSGAHADNVLGQPDFTSDIVTNITASLASTTLDNTSSVDTLQSPTSLAYDGFNLYVADPFNRRVLQFTPSDVPLPDNSALNWASEIIRQEGIVVFTAPGTITANDTATVTIAGTGYTYTVKTADTLDSIVQGVVTAINAGAGDPNAQAIFGGIGSGTIYLSSKQSNLPFDALSLAASTSNTVNLIATASGSYLTAGTAATGAPGMLVEINAQPGTTLASDSAVSPTPAGGTLPTALAGVQVLVDGIPAGLLGVSPNQIVFQLSYALIDRTSVSIYVKTQRADGTTTITNATPMYIAPANPGLFNQQAYTGQPRPWPAFGALHQPGNPSAVVSIDGSVKAGDVATITVAGKTYNYTVVAADSLASITQNLVNQINNAPDPNVTASVGAAFTRVVLTAIQPGASGNGIAIAGSVNTGASVTATAYSSTTCCDVPSGQPISPASPAVPGETITLLGSGLGFLATFATQQGQGLSGHAFSGPVPNTANDSVSATMNGVTAQVISAGLPLYSYGIYQIQIVVPTTLTANPVTQVYIAQDAFISNTVTLPVGTAGQSVSASPTPIPVPTPGFSDPGAGITTSQIVLSPTNLAFASQALGGKAPKTQLVNVHNPSSSPVSIQSMYLTGLNPGDYTFGTNCGTSIAANSTCYISVTFTPSSQGISSALIAIWSGANPINPQTIVLNGAPFGAFEIVNQVTGLAIDIPGASTASGVAVQQNYLLATPTQRWTLVPVGPNLYNIQNLGTGKVLDVRNGSYDDGALIQQYDGNGGSAQLWTLVPGAEGFFSIVRPADGKALDLSGINVQQATFTGSPFQQWRLTSFQAFNIRNASTGNVFDLKDASRSDFAAIQQLVSTGGPAQQFYVIPVDATYQILVSALTGKVLEVTNGSNSIGTGIDQNEYTGAANQLWALVPAQLSTFAIINKQTGRALEVPGSNPANLVPIQQNDYVKALNQQWFFDAVTTPGQ